MKKMVVKMVMGMLNLVEIVSELFWLVIAVFFKDRESLKDHAYIVFHRAVIGEYPDDSDEWLWDKSYSLQEKQLYRAMCFQLLREQALVLMRLRPANPE